MARSSAATRYFVPAPVTARTIGRCRFDLIPARPMGLSAIPSRPETIGANAATTCGAPSASPGGSPPRGPARRRSRIPTSTADAIALWQRSTDAHDTMVETYLGSRHLTLPTGNAVIRHHPQIGLYGEPNAIMVALMRDVVTDRPVAVHRTYIDHTGHKTGRKMLGPCGSAAIKLAPATDVLVVAEGLETALAATAAGMTPVWAMGTAGAIGALTISPTVATLVILAEIDRGASRSAVASCADRWSRTGKHVFVVRPTIGKDFADVWAHASTSWRDLVEIKQMRA